MISFESKKGRNPHAPKKNNQDIYIVENNFMGRENFHLFGVCDGHGVNGHLVSNFVKKQLPSNTIHSQN